MDILMCASGTGKAFARESTPHSDLLYLSYILVFFSNLSFIFLLFFGAAHHVPPSSHTPGLEAEIFFLGSPFLSGCGKYLLWFTVLSLVPHIHNNNTSNKCLQSTLSYTTLLFKYIALVRTDLILKLPTQNQTLVSNIIFQYTVRVAMFYPTAY